MAGDSRPRAIFFDAAGTLFHPREPIARSYAKVAREHGVDLAEGAVNASFRAAFHDAVAPAFGPGHPAAELRQLERDWWRNVVARTFAQLGTFRDFDAFFDSLFRHFANPATWIADAQAETVLSQLASRKFKMGVISNFDYRLYAILQGLGLARHFEAIVISSEAGYAKPDPEIFRIAMRRFGVEPPQSVHVGDSREHDLAAATVVGMRAVLIDPDAPADGGASADAIHANIETISSLAHLLELAQISRFA
jgi:putative hydrolase of the HAD superfamily